MNAEENYTGHEMEHFYSSENIALLKFRNLTWRYST